ncbi:related to pisatin demethylase / cytochrome P450 monooxygenase [Phialocephala subalpina]|uniref:Related to pisatin demethylase / cytochrome P450 monooxygenase n=1 Tax=Phialocephala subalpina TaxID=576137 RepID=A0A1L7X180_9HELO|nr:related to pisatin demethylase / cytochrome P450 monooxygenase [Phialocephala subalpina]
MGILDTFLIDVDRPGLFAAPILFAKSHVLLLFTVLALLYLVQIIYYLSLHPLHKIPGPFLAQFSGIWKNVRYFRSTWHRDILELHDKYGPVVRIGPNEVSFVDAKALGAIYGHGTTAKKIECPTTDDILVMQGRRFANKKSSFSFFASQDVMIHRALRSRVSAAYSMTSILAMEPYIQEVADKTWAKFRGFADSGQIIDFGEWIPYFTFDVVGQLSLGGEIGFVEMGEDIDDIISSIHIGFYMMANMGSVPLQMFWLNNYVTRFIVERFGSAKMNAFQGFLRWLEQRVTDRMKYGLGTRRRDMLQHFIEMKGIQGRPTGVGDVMIEGVNILGAGADTTSIAILAILGDLILHPEIVPHLQAEVDQAYKDLGHEEKQTEIGYKEASALPYLAAVIKESMRLHPSIQYQLPRHPAEGGVTIGPYQIPQSAEVSISPRSMNRCKEIFSSDANEFRPSRWQFSNEKEEEAVKEMSRLLTTFGLGSRVCVGQNLALVEVYKFIAQFVHKFDMKLADPQTLWTTKTQWFSMQHDFNVRLEARR